MSGKLHGYQVHLVSLGLPGAQKSARSHSPDAQRESGQAGRLKKVVARV
jgi:hypothetical protein